MQGTRALYAPFESDLRSCSSDVYSHEMPGGQYTNLKFQVRWALLHGYWHHAADVVQARGQAPEVILCTAPTCSECMLRMWAGMARCRNAAALLTSA